MDKKSNALKTHLESRNFCSGLYEVPPALDESEGTVTFYLYNLSGQIVGYQQYRPDADKQKRNNPKEGRYYTYAPKGRLAVWGVETLHWDTSVLFVVEGIFDAVRIHNMGYPCVAILTSNPKPLKGWLRSLNRTLLGVCDPGPAGKYIKRYTDRSITMTDHDLGDATDEEVELVVKKLLNGT